MLQKSSIKVRRELGDGKRKSEGVDESEERCEFMHTHM